ncbi:MAG: hypothetical protein IJV76_07710 [Clostridia bacterium]|nr:hypothetical protein [Clostridia bacterium]
MKSVGKGRNRSESFTFTALPTNVTELQALPEASLDSAFKTTALTIVALARYEQNPDESIAMLNFLKGPAEVSTYEKQFIRERLTGRMYTVRSFFAGATPQNSYTPTTPYTVTVSETPYSFDNDNWATLYVTSGGADNPRPIKLRKKPSTGQWFLNDIQCLADIRVPVEEDPWA